jgi:ABC-type glycerol-3-phosphate transport system permease component
MNQLRSVLFYTLLALLALGFLFPLLWMVVTSFKVQGTGDKFLYIPVEKIGFQEATAPDFMRAALKFSPVEMAKLEGLRAELYQRHALPSEREMFLIIDQALDSRLDSKKQSLVLKYLSPRYDINKIDRSQLHKIEKISHEEAEAILAFRHQKGGFDSPADLGSVPLFNTEQVQIFLGFFLQDPTVIHRLQEQPYRRALDLTREREKVYLSYRKLNGLSVQDPDEIGRIHRFSRAKVQSWKPYFFSNRLYTLKNYKKLISTSPRGDQFTLPHAFLNSMIVSVATALLTLILCLLAGYVFAKKEFTGKKQIYSALWASMLIPGMMFLVPQYAIVTWLDGINTYWAMIVPHSANIFGLYLIKQYIEQIPHSLFEAASIDGASELQIFRVLVIPLTLPILTTLFLLTFLGQWSNFLWQLITNTPDSMHMTLPVTLAFFKGQYASDWTALMAGATLMLLPIIILFFFAQRTLIQGMTEGAVKE